MKVSPIFLLALASDADDKKVPPRHPKNRLKTLRRFALEWLADNFRDYQTATEQGQKAGKRLYDRFSPRFSEDHWFGRMNGLINDEEKDCFFYDPNSPHGGRSRRQATADEGGNEDYDDSRAADDMIRYDKNNPIRGLKQITTGFRKWARRYINECPGEDGSNGNGPQQHSKRATNLNNKIKKRLQWYLNKFGPEN